MKRDMDLVRQILLRIEAVENRLVEPEMNFDGYPRHVVIYHTWLLIDAGLVDGDVSYYQSPHADALVRGLTWKGHEFLDEIRDESVWNKTKQKIGREVGSASVEIVREVAKSIIKGLIGLP